MKRISCIFICCLLVMSVLTACGGQTSSITKQTTISADSTATAAASSTEEASKKDVTLNFMSWPFNAEKQTPQKTLDDFHAMYPNITVTLSGGGMPPDQYINSQKIKLMGGDGIDITSIRPETLSEYAKANYLLELKDVALLSNYNSSVFDGLKVDGKLYSVPRMISVIGVYYNKDLFNKLNIVEPKNWDEFTAALDKIKASGTVPMMNGGKDSWPMEFDIYPFIHDVFVKNPDIFTKLDKGEVKYTDQVWLDAFKKIDEFYKKGYVKKEGLSTGYDGAATAFLKGQTPVFIHGDWVASSLSGKDKDGNEIKPSFEVGIMPLPYNKAGEETVVPITVSESIAIVASTKYKEEAMKFLEFMSSVESTKYLEAFSPIKGATADFNTFAAQFKPILDMKSTDFFYNKQFPAANSEMLKQLQLMVLGKVKPEDALKAIQSEQDKKVNAK
jgi:raffinose/stachyose/melibiose transport system substrate-binding protein